MNLLKRKGVSIGDNSYAYSELFKRIKNQNINDHQVISNRERVYWGQVESIIKLNNGDVNIIFSEKATFKTASATTTISIKRSILNNYRFKRPIVDAITNSIGAEKNKLMAYVFGTPKLEVDVFVNFNFYPLNLDLIEIKKI